MRLLGSCCYCFCYCCDGRGVIAKICFVPVGRAGKSGCFAAAADGSEKWVVGDALQWTRVRLKTAGNAANR